MPGAVTVENTGPSRVDPASISQLEASFVRPYAGSRKIGSQVGLLAVAQPNPLNDCGVVAA
jgi:hypothetical protein